MLWTNMSSGTSALLDVAREVVSSASSADSAAAVELVVRACFPLAQAASPSEREALLTVLAPALEVPALEHALLVAQLCGALIEQGAPASHVEGPLIRRYVELSAGARKFYDASGPVRSGAAEAEAVRRRLPAEYAAYELLVRSSAPAVALLAASARARANGRALADLLRPIADQLAGVRSIVTLASVLDDAPLLALEPSSLTGIRGRISGVSSDAQLLVLLMAAFPRAVGTPPRVSPAVLENARGIGPQRPGETVTATFSLYAWPAARTFGSSDDAAHVLSSKGRPESIPVFEGARAVLLGAPDFTPNWRAEREFAGLRADLTVDGVLSRSEVSAALSRMSSSALMGSSASRS